MTHLNEILSDDVDLLTRAEVKKMLRCSHVFLYQLRKKGKIQAIKAGKKVLFKRSAVNAFINSNQEGGTPC